MSRKLQPQTNGSLAIYFGVGSLLGSFGALGYMFFWIFETLMGRQDFSWEMLLLFVAIVGLSGFISIALTKVGLEELKK